VTPRPQRGGGRRARGLFEVPVRVADVVVRPRRTDGAGSAASVRGHWPMYANAVAMWERIAAFPGSAGPDSRTA
jgi:hypothetical protein